MSNPLTFRKCPHCAESLVDSEISQPMKQFCEPEAFHSNLLFLNDDWVCPHCREVIKTNSNGIQKQKEI